MIKPHKLSDQSGYIQFFWLPDDFPWPWIETIIFTTWLFFRTTQGTLLCKSSSVTIYSRLAGIKRSFNSKVNLLSDLFWNTRAYKELLCLESRNKPPLTLFSTTVLWWFSNFSSLFLKIFQIVKIFLIPAQAGFKVCLG